MEVQCAALNTKLTRLEKDIDKFRTFFKARQAQLVQKKELLDQAAHHNAMKKLILEEESKQLDYQMKLLDEEKKLFESILTEEHDQDHGLMEQDHQDQTELGTSGSGDVKHEKLATPEHPGKPKSTIEIETKSEPKTTTFEDIQQSPASAVNPDSENIVPATLMVFPTGKLNVELKIKDSESELGSVVQQRSSRGRLIKAKNRDMITFTGNSSRQTNKVLVFAADSSDVPTSTGDIGDIPIPTGTRNVTVTKIIDGVPDESTAVGINELETTEKLKKLQEPAVVMLNPVPVRFSARTRKQRKEYSPEPDPETDKLEITTDEESNTDSDSQASPKKLRIKKLAARSIKVYIPVENLPQKMLLPPRPRPRSTSPRKMFQETFSKSVDEKADKVDEPQQAESNKKPLNAKQSTKSLKSKSSSSQAQVEIVNKKKRRPPQKCSFCPKVFNTSHGRKYHELNHQGKKPHQCHLCDLAFVQKALLKRHLFRHTGEPREKKHQCKVCQHSFALKYDLVLHSKRHDPERKQECGVCRKFFSDPRYFKKHVAICTTDAQDLKCSTCQRQYRVKTFLDKHLEVCRARAGSAEVSTP